MTTGAGRLDAVLFDMDGTLVETEPLWLVAETETMRALGAGWTEEDQARCLGGPIERVMAYMVDKAGGGHDPAEVKDLVLSWMERLLRSEPIHWADGAEALLAALDEAGVPVALVSASYRRLVDVVLEKVGSGRFATTVAGDEVSRTKPDPEPYLLAAARLGADPRRCVVVEDSPTGVAAGVAAGCAVVAVPHLVEIVEGPRVRIVDSLRDVTVADLRRWAAAPPRRHSRM